MRLTPQRPDLFVGVSADILKQHRMRGAVGPREASAVVYNRPALDISGARAERQDRPFTFGLLGRVGRDKGTFVALEAYRRLVQGEDRPLELLIGGEASDGDAAELRSRTPDEGKVRLLGAVDPADFYARVDCALVPTQWPEPFGRTAAEALLAGVPLLASAAGGLPEVVDAYGGRAALVAEFTDPASWADAMSKSMHGPLPAVPSGPPLPEPHSAYLNVYERVLHAHRGKKNGSARPFRRVPRRPSPSSDGRRQRVREQAPD